MYGRYEFLAFYVFLTLTIMWFIFTTYLSHQDVSDNIAIQRYLFPKIIKATVRQFDSKACWIVVPTNQSVLDIINWCVPDNVTFKYFKFAFVIQTSKLTKCLRLNFAVVTVFVVLENCITRFRAFSVNNKTRTLNPFTAFFAFATIKRYSCCFVFPHTKSYLPLYCLSFY